MMGGGPEEHTTTQTTEPPAWAVPYLHEAASGAQAAYRRPREFFPGQTYVDPSQQTLSALNQMEMLAGSSPYATPGGDTLAATLRGDFLAPEALETATRGAVARALPGTMSESIAAGRTGSPAQARAVTQTVGDIMSGAYNAERGRQMQAMGMIPMMEAQRYAPAEALGRVGAAREQIASMPLQEAMHRHQFEQEEQRQRAAEYAGLLQGVIPMAGQVGTTTQPVYNPSPFSQLAGLGLTAAGAYFNRPTGGGGK